MATVELTGDLQFDLAEALMETGEQHKALGILDLLIASPQFSTMAAVWLRHAECCRACAEVEKALRSYQRCIELAPGHVHTYVLYSELLRASGRCKTAIEVSSALCRVWRMNGVWKPY